MIKKKVDVKNDPVKKKKTKRLVKNSFSFKILFKENLKILFYKCFIFLISFKSTY